MLKFVRPVTIKFEALASSIQRKLTLKLNRAGEPIKHTDWLANYTKRSD